MCTKETDKKTNKKNIQVLIDHNRGVCVCVCVHGRAGKTKKNKSKINKNRGQRKKGEKNKFQKKKFSGKGEYAKTRFLAHSYLIPILEVNFDVFCLFYFAICVCVCVCVCVYFIFEKSGTREGWEGGFTSMIAFFFFFMNVHEMHIDLSSFFFCFFLF